MHIGIVAWERDEIESHDVARVVRRMGHRPAMFLLEDITCRTAHGRLEVMAAGLPAEDLDMVLSRAMLRSDRLPSVVDRIRALSAVVPVVDDVDAVLRANSKLLTIQRLMRAGIPVPPTHLVVTVEAVRDLRASEGAVVVKPSSGHGGHDVELVEGDFESARPAVEAVMRKHHTALVQPYLPHPGGDIRANVVAGRLMACFRRIPGAGGWKTNVAQGATVHPYEPTARLREIAEAVARAMELGFAALDMLEWDGDYLVTEVNTVPMLEVLPQLQVDEMIEAWVTYGIGQTVSLRA